ncbi:MAG: DUF1549 domain-containing protein, partial [Planctomycetia bacterium]|nr:DUF1549 domain-containing protein [Planctomycetia bacterium]
MKQAANAERLCRTSIFVVAAVALWWPSASSFSQQKAPVDFGREIQPLFARQCYRCHGPNKQEGGLRLDKQEVALAEVDSGKVPIVPKQPDKSELLRRISSADPDERMPPEGKPLSAEQTGAVRRWIEQGATWKPHWAFQKPVQPAVPEVRDKSWVRTPIDAFILSKLEQRGLKPSPPADKIALLRRAYYDLTGLPPSLSEVEAFLADDSPPAFEKVVDRLLDSPHYGERWARHWLDAVRFAETNSFERDGVKPNAWRYRDYVIRSFNDDKPYDRFILEQLAGDELSDVSPETIIATGYYRLGLWDDEPADALQARYDELDDIVSTTGQVFLGMTVGCARCHDHKIDPIPQADYYRLLSFFHGVHSYGNRGDQASFSQADISPPEVAEQHAKRDAQMRELRDKLTEIEERGIAKMSGEDQRKTETRQRERVLREKLKDFLGEEDWKTYGDLKAEFEKVKSQSLPQREMALAVKEQKDVPETFVLVRGNPHVRGEKVTPAFPGILCAPLPEIVPPGIVPPGDSSSPPLPKG